MNVRELKLAHGCPETLMRCLRLVRFLGCSIFYTESMRVRTVVIVWPQILIRFRFSFSSFTIHQVHSGSQKGFSQHQFYYFGIMIVHNRLNMHWTSSFLRSCRYSEQEQR